MSDWLPPQGYPPNPHPSGGPAIITMGDIHVTRTHVVLPHGRYPLKDTMWHVNDHVYPSQATPDWAVIAALVGFVFVCVFSLLFLLAKETRLHGHIEVVVTGPGGLHHVTRFPAAPHTAAWVHQQVNHARALATSA